MDSFSKTISCITPESISVYGLKYFPSLEPHIDNNQDTPAFDWPTGPEVSDCNLQIATDVLQRLKDSHQNKNKPQVIVEIGVHRNKGGSITNVLLTNRLPNSIYFGIDLDDKTYINDRDRNIHTIRCNSHDQSTIRNKFRMIGIDHIDLLMIDGWHSVNTCVNDWCYADMLSPDGVVMLHDTNAHPGCIALYDAVNETLFDKVRHCVTDDDMGIATFWHKGIAST